MAKVMIEPTDAQNVKSLVRVAVENELKILKAGVAITHRKLECTIDEGRHKTQLFCLQPPTFNGRSPRFPPDKQHL